MKENQRTGSVNVEIVIRFRRRGANRNNKIADGTGVLDLVKMLIRCFAMKCFNMTQGVNFPFYQRKKKEKKKKARKEISEAAEHVSKVQKAIQTSVIGKHDNE